MEPIPEVRAEPRQLKRPAIGSPEVVSVRWGAQRFSGCFGSSRLVAGRRDSFASSAEVVVDATVSLVALPRSGAHMLRTAVDGHPLISCCGGFFNPDHPAGRHCLANVTAVPERVVVRQRGETTVGFRARYFDDSTPAETAPQQAWPP